MTDFNFPGLAAAPRVRGEDGAERDGRSVAGRIEGHAGDDPVFRGGEHSGGEQPKITET